MPTLSLSGIITRICTDLQHKFSKVTVKQVVPSGKVVATITVDGVPRKLYVPEPPTASIITPLMDGTASYGSGTSYARSNHRHPTDTSRQAALVSGTNIKTINGASILGSGDITTPTYTLPTASTSTLGGVKVDGSTITITNGVISSSGGGGGVSYTKQAVSIPTSAWSGTTATVSAAAVTATNDVIVAPAPASISAWAAAGVYCSAQGAGTLTLTCSTAPTAALTANVMAFDGGASVLPHSIINDGGICRSITLDGSYGVGVTDKEAEAMPGDVVTIAVPAITPHVYDADGNELPTTQVGSYQAGGSTRPPVPATAYLVFSFTMPNSEATIYGG